MSPLPVLLGILLLIPLTSSNVSAESDIPRKNAVNVFVGNTQNGSLNGASVGVGYEFEVATDWAIVPEYNVEFVEGRRQLVYGVSAQYAF